MLVTQKGQRRVAIPIASKEAKNYKAPYTSGHYYSYSL